MTYGKKCWIQDAWDIFLCVTYIRNIFNVLDTQQVLIVMSAEKQVHLHVSFIVSDFNKHWIV
jgi:hypothetical protein